MARKDKVFSRLSAASVGPETEALKTLFEGYSIPLETSYAALIDVADCGRRATGQSPDFPANNATGLVLDDNRQLCVRADVAKGVEITASGVGAVLGEAIVSDDIGIGVLANTSQGIQVGSSGVGVIANTAAGIDVDNEGIRLAEGFRVAPVGAIMMWPSTSPPDGWLICDGATYNQVEYPVLAAFFSQGSSFKVPDFRGRLPCAPDPGGSVNTPVAGKTGLPDGLTITTLQDGEHTHQYYRNNTDGGITCDPPVGDDYFLETPTSTQPDHEHAMSYLDSFTYASNQSIPNSTSICFIIAHD